MTDKIVPVSASARIKLRRDKDAVFADQFAIEPHFPAAVVGALDADHVPMDLAAVAVAADFIGLTRGEVEGPGNLLVEENIADVRRMAIELRPIRWYSETHEHVDPLWRPQLECRGANPAC